jgi:hypothetical protein
MLCLCVFNIGGTTECLLFSHGAFISNIFFEFPFVIIIFSLEST